MAEDKAERYLEENVLRFSIGRTPVKVLGFDKVEYRHDSYDKVHAKNHYELHYVIGGSGILVVDEIRYELRKGDFYLTGPGLIYRELSDVRNPVNEYTLIIQLESGYNGELSQIIAEKNFFLCHDFEECNICFRSAEREINEKQCFYAEALENDFKQIIIMLLRRYESDIPVQALPKAAKDDKYCLLTDVQFVLHLKDITLSKLSGVLGLSVRQCQRFLIDNYGMSYSEKLMQSRMLKAADYLAFTDKEIQTIGEEVGYSGSSYFTRVFKRYFGITPREYRKKYKD